MRVSLSGIFGKKGHLTAMALIVALGGTITAPSVLPGNQAAMAASFSSSTHERLSRYGEWRTSSRFGEVWVPTVQTGWRPYTVGHWVWTDDGWYWQSDEPFGWVVFHYGRWAFDQDIGWVWIAGNDWAPAWVVWRESDEDIGWVPAPPPTVVVEDDWWSFVPVAAIGAVAILPVLRPVSDNVVIVRNTTIINENITVNNYRGAGTVRLGNTVVPVNAGPPLSRLPGSVVSSVRAAKVVPPKSGAIAAAHLDPSKAAVIKASAVRPMPAQPQTPVKPGTSTASAAQNANPAVVQKKPAGVNASAQNNNKAPVVPAKPVSPAGPAVAASGPVKPVPPVVNKHVVNTNAAPHQLLMQRQAALLQQRKTAQAKALIARQQAVKRQQAMVTHARTEAYAQAMSHRPTRQMQAKRVVKCGPHDPRCKRAG